ncbi:MAG: hypothetical protein GH145_02745 [Firmicutes bacterium]|jgi:hypothetical protein|nr:hypothetical protein [Bacillota bacterium]
MAKVKCFESERVVVECTWLKCFAKMMYVGLRSMKGQGEFSKETAALRSGQPANVAAKSLRTLEKVGLIKNGAGKSGKNGIEFILITGSEKEQKDLLEKLKQPAEVKSE